MFFKFYFFKCYNPYAVDKLLLSNNEEHVISFFNEKINMESQENLRKTTNISFENIKETCEKLMKIIDQPYEEFVNEYFKENGKILNEKKEVILRKEESIENNENREEKNNELENDLFCSDEKLTNKMEIEENESKSNKLSYFELKKQRIFKEFINVLKNLES
jgi:hypothetical protein